LSKLGIPPRKNSDDGWSSFQSIPASQILQAKTGALRGDVSRHNSWQRIDSMGRVIALMDDIFFQMKVAETAKHLGLEFKVATNVDALMGLLEPAPQLVIVDLNARSKPVEAIAKVRGAAKNVRVVAFLSHVQRELAEQARAAGCEEVMPRSSFTQNLAEILSPAKA
jgi:CheY-like chemotaxis protein